MGHLGNIRAEYRELADRLEQNVVGLPRPESPEGQAAWLAILELLYQPGEAALGARLPRVPSRLAELERLLGVPAAELGPQLDAMADKGLVMDLRLGPEGQRHYSLSPPIVGFLELSFMKLGTGVVSKQALAELIAVYGAAGPDFVRGIHGAGNASLGRAVPYPGSLALEQLPTVTPWQKVEEIVRGASCIAVSLCYCRHKAEHLGQACQAPQRVCLSLNSYAEFVVRRRFGQELGQAEALEVLAESRRHHLVHMVDNVKNEPAWLCNCCSCCCGALKAMAKHGYPAVRPSGYLPSLSDSACNGCGACVRRCPAKALLPDPESRRPRLEPDKCLGCGVCVGACRRAALSLVQAFEPQVPADRLELSVLRALERGKLACLVQEDTDEHGMMYLEQIFRIVAGLDADRQAQAQSQLGSRFLAYLMGSAAQ